MNTQKDVAKKAGVSRATVSAVLNENKFVSKELKEKVLEAINELNYEVNSIARSLKNKKTYTIGVIIEDIFSGFYFPIVHAIEDIAKKYGYSMILCNQNNNPDEELKYLKVLKSSRADGIIMVPTGKNVNYINQILEMGPRIVFLDRLADGIECDAVLVNNCEGAYLAVKHLIDNGFKKIAIINGFIDLTTGKERLKGYLKALTEAGIPKNDEYIKICKVNEKKVNKLLLELLESDDKPDAIFTSREYDTFNTIKIIKKLKLKIPEDIAITGFDDSYSKWSRITSPSITCVRQPLHELGETAAELLFKKINNIHTNLRDKPQVVILNTDLVVRDSSLKR